MRTRLAARAVAACLLAGLATTSAAAQDGPPPVVVGVNVVNPQWQPRAEQDRTLDAVRASGTRVIRIPLVPPTGGTYEGTVEYIARAASRGLGVLLIVYPAFPPDAPARPKVADETEMWSLPPLSAADPKILAADYGPALRRLDERGIRLVAIEFGNEINWTAFNGEFPVAGRGLVLGDADLESDAIGFRVADGYRAYLRSLAELKRLRDGLVLNRATPILAGGFADFGQGGDRTGTRQDAVAVGASLRFMRRHGLDALADGYSIHTYPAASDSAAARREKLIRNVLAECGTVAGIGKPCWLTEWGFGDSTPCRADDDPRARMVSEFRDDLRGAVRAGSVRALVYYAWGGGPGDPHALLRCGRLMSGGKAALAPYDP